MKSFSMEYIEELKDVVDGFPHDQFDRLIDAMMDTYHNEKRIFVMGNGGSASTASHWFVISIKGAV